MVLCLVFGLIGLLAGAAPAFALSYVRSVEYVEIPLTAAGGTQLVNSVSLTKSQTIANCVPFASVAPGAANDENFDETFVDVFFQSGPTRVTAQRGFAGSGQAVTVGVFVVEFDPNYVRVQSNTWTMARTATSSTSGPLTFTVDLGKAALVSYFRLGELAASADRIWQRVAISGRFSSTSQLTWERFAAISAGSPAATANGHYYVFESLGNVFSVQAKSFQVTTGNTTGTATLSPSVNLGKSFVVASYRTEYDDDQPEDGIVGVYLSATNTLTAQRQYSNSSATDQFWIEAFVVTFSPYDNARVQRGTLAYASGAGTATAAVNSVDLTDAIVWNGVAMPGPGVMQSDSGSSGTVDSAFQRLRLSDAVTVRGDRVDTGSIATGRFEVIDWPVAPTSQMQILSGSYVGDTTNDRAIFVGFQPDVVIIDRDCPACPDEESAIRTSTMANDTTKDMDGATAFTNNRIKLLTTTGFTLGTDADVNEAATMYHWVAFKAGAGEMAVGSYPGNNTDATNITGLGFQPVYVIVIPSTAQLPLQRSATMVGDLTSVFSAGWAADQVQALLADGFQVGSAAGGANSTGTTYHYIAWKAVTGRVTVGAYAGTTAADNRNITGTGFWPEYAIVTRSTVNAPTHKTASSGVNVDRSMLFDTSNAQADNIQQLQPDGFQVGTQPRVNTTGSTHHWVAFGPHTAGINYRAIGVGADYTTGTVTATNGSRIVDAAGGALWLTANRGRGDVLDLTGEVGTTTLPCRTRNDHSYVVEAVLSETQLLLQHPYQGTTGSGKPYLLRRQVNSPSLWAWRDIMKNNSGGTSANVAWGETPPCTANLVAEDRSEVGILYADDGADAGTVPDPWVAPCSTCEVINIGNELITGPNHTITLTADGPNRHYGIPGDGVVLENTWSGSGNTFPAIAVDTEYVTVEWMEIRNGASNAPGIRVPNNLATPHKVVLRYNLIHDTPPAGIEVLDTEPIADIYNNILYGSGLYGIDMTPGVAWGAGSVLNVFNNTAYGKGNYGFAMRTAANNRPALLLENNIGHSNTTAGFNFANAAALSAASSHNLSSDASAQTASPAGSWRINVSNITFQNPGAGNLHLSVPGDAGGNGQDLSASIPAFDIDRQGRVNAWEIGADEFDGFTAVRLAGFSARGYDGAVLVEWQTASELDNLGFNLYRGGTAAGPWTRLNPARIPGLGSSPEGRGYSWPDRGLTNGVSYYYWLEDVDRSGRVTSHGPVSAQPALGEALPAESGGDTSAGDAPASASGAAWRAHGEPTDVALRVLQRTARGLTLELRTGGFYSQAQPDGTLRFRIPGFFETTEPGLPAMPVKRTWIDAVVGRSARVVSVQGARLIAFPRMIPARAGAAEAVARPDGTYRAAFRRVRAKDARGLFPEAAARILETAFQEQSKKAYLELAPLRLDGARGRLVLARRLVVRIAFDGRAEGEAGSGGSRGRKRPAPQPKVEGAPLVRLAVRAAGLHAVSWESLTGSTATLQQRGALPSAWLRLSRVGQPVAFHVEPRADRFAPGSTLYFLAEGPESAYGTETVYELAIASGGIQMPVAGVARAAATVVDSLVATRSYEQNTNYLPALLSSRDLWFWDIGLLAPNGRDYPFVLAAPGAGAGPARLSVDLVGGSDAPKVDPDHLVRVLVNGVPVGEASWDGLNPFRFEAAIDPSVLVDGPNTLRLDGLDTTGAFDSVVYLDRFELQYPRRLVADAGRLEGRASVSGLVRASGFPSGALLLDVSTTAPVWQTPGLSGMDLVFPVEAQKRYLATAPDAVFRPEVRPAAPGTLRASTHQADWIVIAPEELLPAAAPLLALRESQGLSARAISLEQIQDEFGYGERSPQMLREFLAYAYHGWAAPSVRYVLLLGDATSDPKGYMAPTARPNLLPTPLVKSTFLWTASDPLLAAVNGDDTIPDLAIGRLSAGSLAEAQAAVGKILAFEQGRQTLDGRAVLVTDNPDLAGNFEANADDIEALLSGRSVEQIRLTQRGAQTRGAVLAAFDAGASLVSYVGHGSQALWASEGILRSIDVALLEPQPRQPLMLTMTCSNGYFISPFLNGIAERFVLERDKGAIAAFSPSGLSLDDAAHVYHRALVQQLAGARHERLGDLVLAAQQDYAASGAFPELLSIYHLFADPALRIR